MRKWQDNRLHSFEAKNQSEGKETCASRKFTSFQAQTLTGS